jgi:predicted Zn-dependent peptidase
MLSMGKSLLMDGEIKNVQTISEKIETVNPEEILEVANEVFDPDQLSTLIYKSKENAPARRT